MLNCDSGPWHGLPCASSLDVVHGSVVSEELMESAEMGKGKKASREHAGLWQGWILTCARGVGLGNKE